VPQWLTRLLCRMRWHLSYTPESFDGASVHARCNWCGYRGLLDSQGALF
jgi:hypothetical protein